MPELPKLTAKEAEKLLLINGFEIHRQKVAIEFISKALIECFYRTIAGKFCTQKS